MELENLGLNVGPKNLGLDVIIHPLFVYYLRTMCLLFGSHLLKLTSHDLNILTYVCIWQQMLAYMLADLVTFFRAPNPEKWECFVLINIHRWTLTNNLDES